MKKLKECIAIFKQRLSDTWTRKGENLFYTNSQGKQVEMSTTSLLENAVVNNTQYLEHLTKGLLKKYDRADTKGLCVRLHRGDTAYDTGIAGAVALVELDYDPTDAKDRTRVENKLEKLVLSSFKVERKSKAKD